MSAPSNVNLVSKYNGFFAGTEPPSEEIETRLSNLRFALDELEETWIYTAYKQEGRDENITIDRWLRETLDEKWTTILREHFPAELTDPRNGYIFATHMGESIRSMSQCADALGYAVIRYNSKTRIGNFYQMCKTMHVDERFENASRSLDHALEAALCKRV